MTNFNYILGQTETYNTESQNVISFHKVDDIVKGIECRLSNMAGGFPFRFAYQTWQNSEVLYLCGEFSHNSEEHQEIQDRLFRSKSGYAAKRFVKSKYKKQARDDFKEFRLDWMLYVVWQKCLNNKNFCKLLLSTKDYILVEDTTTDNQGTAEVWGAQDKEQRAAREAALPRIEAEAERLFTRKADKENYINKEYNKIQKGVFVGQNNIGKILMICRQCLIEGTQPKINYALLQKANIHIFGIRLDFSDKIETENTMTLQDGAVLKTYPIQGKETEGNDDLYLDTSGKYLATKKADIKPSTAPTEEAERQKKLFTDNAFFLFANSKKILANSRMFLAPIQGIDSGLMYSGESGFQRPTLGVYIEWWRRCSDAIVTQEDGRVELIYKFKGSPLSGVNHCSLVDSEGNTHIVSLTNFCNIWPSFMTTNQLYTPYKDSCAAFTLKEVIDILQCDEQDNKELRTATIHCYAWRSKARELERRLKEARQQILSLNKELTTAKIQLNMDKILSFYNEYLKWRAKAERRLVEIHEERVALRKRLRNGELTHKEYQPLMSPLKKEMVGLRNECESYGNGYLQSLIPDCPLTITTLQRFFLSHKEYLTNKTETI